MLLTGYPSNIELSMIAKSYQAQQDLLPNKYALYRG